MRKSKAWLWISLVLTGCFTAFILYNSMQYPGVSNKRSEDIVSKLQSFASLEIQTYKNNEIEVVLDEKVSDDIPLDSVNAENSEKAEKTENAENAENSEISESTEIVQDDSELSDETEEETLEKKLNRLVRKAAHAIEYALLGAAVCGVFLCIYAKKGRIYITIPILYVIGVALADEFLQTFYMRSGLVRDVLLDFVSGMVAFFMVFAIVKIAKFRKRRKERA